MTQFTLSAATQNLINVALTSGAGYQNDNYVAAYNAIYADLVANGGINAATVAWFQQAGFVDQQQWVPTAQGTFIWAYTEAAATSEGATITDSELQAASNKIASTVFQTLKDNDFVFDDSSSPNGFSTKNIVRDDAGAGITLLQTYAPGVDYAIWGGSLFARTELQDSSYFSDYNITLQPNTRDSAAILAGLAAGGAAVLANLPSSITSTGFTKGALSLDFGAISSVLSGGQKTILKWSVIVGGTVVFTPEVLAGTVALAAGTAVGYVLNSTANTVIQFFSGTDGSSTQALHSVNDFQLASNTQSLLASVAVIDASSPNSDVDFNLVSNSDGSVELLTSDGTVSSQPLVEFASDGFTGDTINISQDSSGTVDVTTDIGAGDTGSVAVDNSFTGVSQEFNFAGSSGTLALDAPGSFTGTISNFEAGDTIDLVGIAATDATLGPSNTLTVTESSGDGSFALQLDPSESFTGVNFDPIPDGQGGTDIVLTKSLFGIGYSMASFENYLESIDPLTGYTTVLDNGHWSSTTFTASQTNAFDAAGGVLSNFNLATGAVTTAPTDNGLEALTYNGVTLIGIGYSTITDDNYLEVINPFTGQATILQSFTFDTGYWPLATLAASPTDAFAVSTSGLLYDFNLATGAITTALYDSGLEALTYNGSTLLGIGYNTITDENYLETINPNTGEVTLLDLFNFDSGYWSPSTFVASQTDAFAVSSSGILYDFHLATGAVTTAQTDSSLETLAINLAYAACFHAGTYIATADGNIPVEQLAEGCLVYAKDSVTAAVKWLGHRAIDCSRHPKPQDVWPVRIMAGAFGSGLPHRDLVLSPDHAVFAEGVLIPVKYLINGSTITQEARDEVTYWHVELERHDVIYAEGLPCESYLDTGNRHAFANGGSVTQLHPDFARDAGEALWEGAACAPLRIAGPELHRAVTRLRRRARELGFPPSSRKRRSSAAPRVKTTSDLAAQLQPAWYLAANPDVATFGMDAAMHYAGWGRAEGRLPCPEIDLIRALGLVDAGLMIFTMSDVVTAGVDPVEHFCTKGWRERRRPNAYFDTGWYLDNYDVPPDMNPLLHYVLTGERLGYRPSQHFDPTWYAGRYALAESISPLAHYLKHRRRQRVSPLPSFDVADYVKDHADTLRQDRDPYLHYLAMRQFTTADFAFGRTAEQAWTNDACVPLVEDGPILTKVQRQLAECALKLGLPVTPVPVIEIATAGRISMVMPAGAEIIRLVSPSDRVDGDRRRLGALVRGLRVDGDHVALNDARLGLGFHEVEVHGAQSVRWTNGSATITLGRAVNDRVIEIDVAAIIAGAGEQRVA